MADDARSLIRGFLRQYGLEQLGDWAWDQFLSGATVDQIMIDIRDHPAYVARFPAMQELAKQGKAISELEYIDYEKSIRSLTQQYGIVGGMYDTPAGISKLLLADVSAAEANSRLQRAAFAAYQAPPEAVSALSEQFGLNDPGKIASWFLDPERAMPLIEQQWATAQISGAARRQHVGVDWQTAEGLSKDGITYEQAVQGFGEVSDTERLGGGFGETASTAQRTRGVFGDAAARTATQRVQRGRQAAFRGGGGGAETQEGVSGLGAASSR